MTEDVTEKEKKKVSFGACFKHEVKNATTLYIETIGLFIAVFVGVVVVANGIAYVCIPHAVWIYMVASLSASVFIDAVWLVVAVVSGIIGSAWESVSDYHVLIMVGVAIICPPIVYALGICTYRRIPDAWKARAPDIVSSIFVGMIVSTAICIGGDLVIMFYNAVSYSQCQYYSICAPEVGLLSWLAFWSMSIAIAGVVFVTAKDNLHGSQVY